MTTISVLGVGIGVFSLVVVLSVMGGFERDLRAKMFKGLPHLEIIGENALAGFSLKELSLDKVGDLYPEAIGVEPFVNSDVVVKRRKHLASVTIIGVDPAIPNSGSLWGFKEGLVAGSIEDLSKQHRGFSFSEQDLKYPGIILGEDIAVQLAADVGDQVTILSPQLNVGDALAGQDVSESFVVVGVFRTDLPRYDSKYAVVSLKDSRRYMAEYDPTLQEEEYVTGIAVNFPDPSDIGVFTDKLTAFPSVNAHTWKETNKSLLFALMLEKFTMGTILFLIVVVAAFSISGTMMMMVYHKRGQVALLRSLGMKMGGIARLYLYHGMVIGGVGALIGLLFGVGACVLLYYFQFIDLPEGLYFQNKLPVRFLPVEYAVIMIISLVLSLLASVYPALVAAKQDPGQGLRFM